MSDRDRRVRFTIAYDGTDFLGWQVQPRGRTVQGEIEDALSRIHGGSRVQARGAGRTDAGVHALAQVADAMVRSDLDDAAVSRSLRGMLPDDIRLVSATTVDAAFHSRHDAITKTYAYRIDRSEPGDPFLARFALHRPGGLDRGAVLDAMTRLPGRRDWSGFTGAAAVSSSKVRHVMSVAMEEGPGSILTLRFEADGFLNHMVRNIVGTLLEVGRGRRSPSRIDEILESRDRNLAGPTAPAHGLCLERVTYPGDPTGDELL